MRLRHSLATAGIGAALLMGGTSVPAHAVSAAPGVSAASSVSAAPYESAAPNESRGSAVTCYLYVDRRRGYYNVRKTKNPRGGLIKTYRGKRLRVWDRCGETVGKSYRCAQGEAKDKYWVAVNYRGRKGYVGSACAGGLGR